MRNIVIAAICGIAATAAASPAFAQSPPVLGAPSRTDYTRMLVSPQEDLYTRGLKAYVDGQFSAACALMMQAAILGFDRADLSYRALQAMMSDSENKECRAAAKAAPRDPTMAPTRERALTR